MAALTEAEARARAALIDVESYDVFLDLTADPVRSRTEVRFGCRAPGAATFADLTASLTGAVLNGRALGPAADGRLALPGLAAENVLVVDAEVADSPGLTRFADPADGAGYLLFLGYPTQAPSLYCCFDQLDLTAVTTLSLVLPAGWEALSNGAARERPAPGQSGVWRFGAVPGTRPFDLTIAAGPYVEEWRGSGGPVAMSIRRRRSLTGAEGVAGIERFGELARQALAYYERVLGVPCPYPKYDIGFVPRLTALAVSIPGLMLVNETLLARMSDPDDDFVAMVCAHEVGHLWFGCHVSTGWWDDLWLDEAMATYMSYSADLGVFADPWTAFCYREKPRAYQADALPGRQPVSSPVASAADALFRLPALTYSKGAAVIRQLAALIGDDALRRGLADYMRRFGGGSARLNDLVDCWSRASGRELAGWAEEWLRTEGASTLGAVVVPGADGTIGSLMVTQDSPRTHRIGIGLYDLAGDRLVRRRVVSAEVRGARCEVPVPGGEAVPDAVVVNDGDLTYAEIAFDERTLGALARSAVDVGDPLTEAVCWNAFWRMVAEGSLAAADFVALVVRRLPGSLPVVGLEVLLEWAVSAADGFAPQAERGRLRADLAGACLAGARQAGARQAGARQAGARQAGARQAEASRGAAGSARQRALASGFAASAHEDGQLSVLRDWLGPRPPDGLVVDGDLRGRILRTLSARGLASAADLDGLVAADPVGGARNRATCLASRPDAAAKEEAWRAALTDTDWRMAVAWARGIWVSGQETMLAGYRDRYFSEALPALEGREVRIVRDLGRALFPGTLCDQDTLAAAGSWLERAAASDEGLRLMVRERETIMRSTLAARSVAPRGWLPA